MLINLLYYCSFCKKEIDGRISTDIPEEDFNEDEIKRTKDYLLSIHKHNEHTVCFNCKKKITPEEFEKKEWKILVIGKGNENPNGPGDTGLRVYTGLFCKDCLETIDKLQK